MGIATEQLLYRNLTPSQLYEHALRRGEGIVTNSGRGPQLPAADSFYHAERVARAVRLQHVLAAGGRRAIAVRARVRSPARARVPRGPTGSWHEIGYLHHRQLRATDDPHRRHPVR